MKMDYDFLSFRHCLGLFNLTITDDGDHEIWFGPTRVSRDPSRELGEVTVCDFATLSIVTFEQTFVAVDTSLFDVVPLWQLCLTSPARLKVWGYVWHPPSLVPETRICAALLLNCAIYALVQL